MGSNKKISLEEIHDDQMFLYDCIWNRIIIKLLMDRNNHTLFCVTRMVNARNEVVKFVYLWYNFLKERGRPYV